MGRPCDEAAENWVTLKNKNNFLFSFSPDIYIAPSVRPYLLPLCDHPLRHYANWLLLNVYF
jgi:hypothetical protein